MHLAIFAGSHSCIFFKLSHKVQFIVIAAESGQRLNRHVGRLQIELCVFYARLNNILNAGGIKETFIETLKMGGAEIDFPCNRSNVPFFCGAF